MTITGLDHLFEFQEGSIRRTSFSDPISFQVHSTEGASFLSATTFPIVSAVYTIPVGFPNLNNNDSLHWTPTAYGLPDIRAQNALNKYSLYPDHFLNPSSILLDLRTNTAITIFFLMSPSMLPKQDVVSLISERKMTADLVTYGCLAKCCRTIGDADLLLKEMEAAMIRQSHFSHRNLN